MMKYEIAEKRFENGKPLYIPVAWTDVRTYATMIKTALIEIYGKEYCVLEDGREKE